MPSTLTTEGVQRVQYMLSPSYCQSWTIKDALRELIANMLDGGGEYRCSHSGNKMVLWNAGQPLKLEHLMIGEGEEKSHLQIGQFKEGLKLALLVLARLGREVQILSPQFELRRLAFEPSPLGKPSLVIYFRTGEFGSGTSVICECSKVEFEQVTSLFLTLEVGAPAKTKTLPEGIYWPDGRHKPGIYVNGLLSTTDIEVPFLFTYNLTGLAKDKLNRDRTLIDWLSVGYQIRSLWGPCEDIDKIKTLLNGLAGTDEYAEAKFEVDRAYIYESAKPTWRKAFAELYAPDADPEKLFIPIKDPHTNWLLEREGYSALDVPEGLASLAEHLFPTAETLRREHYKRGLEEAAQKAECFGSITFIPVSKVHKTLYNSFRVAVSSVCRLEGSASARWFVMDRDCSRELQPRGVQLENAIFINKDLLEPLEIPPVHDTRKVQNIIRTCIHELAHLKSDANDCDPVFEGTLDELAGEIAVLPPWLSLLWNIDDRGALADPRIVHPVWPVPVYGRQLPRPHYEASATWLDSQWYFAGAIREVSNGVTTIWLSPTSTRLGARLAYYYTQPEVYTVCRLSRVNSRINFLMRLNRKGVNGLNSIMVLPEEFRRPLLDGKPVSDQPFAANVR